ncbi:6-bladed beta-propeller [Chloroflexota bacterium]
MNAHRWFKVISLLVMVLLLNVSVIQSAPASAAEPPPVFLAEWGSEGTGDGQFEYPFGVTLDATGNVYVADSSNDRCQKFNNSGTFLAEWGFSGAGDGEFTFPVGIAVDASGNVYVADQNNHRIQKFDDSGNFLLKWGSSGAGDGEFTFPAGIAVDASDNVYVADKGNHRIQKFDNSGTFLAEWGSSGAGDGEFNYPCGVTVDNSGNVYVADTSNQRIQKFDSSATFLTKWGSPGSGDGEFKYPFGVTVDATGNVYVAEQDNNRCQKFESDGTFLAKWGSLGSGDGEFNYPSGVAVDSSGKVYVADTDNARIQVFSPPASDGPRIIAASLASDNAYVDVTFDEGVYNTNGGSGALETGDLAITFTQNGGNATIVTIVSVTQPTGQTLFGGETVIRVNLAITGTPSGVETVEIRPVANAIYNSSGNAASTSESTGGLDLNGQIDWDGPRIIAASLALDNAYVDITFDEGVYDTHDGSGALEIGDLSLSYRLDGSNVTNMAIVSVTKTNGQALAGGETVIRVNLAITGTPSGVEEMGISLFAGAVYDILGNVASASESTSGLYLNDQTAQPGDANGDGSINAQDITKVERIVAGLDPPTQGADANEDGLINALDITKTEILVAGWLD